MGEVFIISIVASLLELSQFAAFIIGDKCDAINELFQDYMPDLFNRPNDHAICFDVISQLDSGCILLFGSAVIATLVGQLVTRTAEQALDERGRPNYVELRAEVKAEVSAAVLEQESQVECGWLLRCARGCGLVRLRVPN